MAPRPFAVRPPPAVGLLAREKGQLRREWRTDGESSDAGERLSSVKNLLEFGVQTVGELLDDAAGNSFSFGGGRRPDGPPDS